MWAGMATRLLVLVGLGKPARRVSLGTELGVLLGCLEAILTLPNGSPRFQRQLPPLLTNKTFGQGTTPPVAHEQDLRAGHHPR